MGVIYVDDPAEIPYGPGNQDYEYDRRVQEAIDMEPMSEIGKQLFEQARLANDMAALHGKIGRQQMAREVLAWVKANASALSASNIEGLLALCNKDLKE